MTIAVDLELKQQNQPTNQHVIDWKMRSVEHNDIQHDKGQLFPSGYFCHLQITFANGLDPDQDRQNVGPDLVPNCLTLWLKNFLKKLMTSKNDTKMDIRKWHQEHEKLASMQGVNIVNFIATNYCQYHQIQPWI